MVRCSCLVLGTTIKSRRAKLLEALHSIDTQASPNLLTSRLISIDDFGQGLRQEEIDVFKKLKFSHIINKRRGMVMSLRQALDEVRTEWVFYSEDDVKFRFLPSKEEFNNIQGITRGGRQCGIMGLCVGGYKKKHNNQELNKKTNYIPITNKLYLLKRNENFRNDYFIDFPSTFMKTELLKSCIDKAIKNGSTAGIEIGISDAWFDLGLDKKFHKVSILQNPWMDNKDANMNIKRYTKELMPIILNSSGRISGGHKFSDV